MLYIKRKHFSHRIQFSIERYDLYEEKLIKNQIFIFFCENRCWSVVFNCKFLIFVQRNLKTEFICALEMFWNWKSPKEKGWYIDVKLSNISILYRKIYLLFPQRYLKICWIIQSCKYFVMGIFLRWNPIENLPVLPLFGHELKL